MLEFHLNNKYFPPDPNVPRIMRYEEEDMDEERTDSSKEEKESPLVWTGTASHNFIKINPNHYSQFELTTYFQGWQEISIIEVRIKKIVLHNEKMMTINPSNV